MFGGKKIGFIGAGNMAEALIRGLLKAKLLNPEEILASDVREERLAYLQDTYAIKTFTDNCLVVADSEIVVLAVKPQIMSKVLDGLIDVIDESKTLISIAAGITTAFIAGKFPSQVRVVRVMPNLPVVVLEGASAIAAGDHATRDDLEIAKKVFRAVGRVVTVEEDAMDAVTGLSGSGPAYIFLIIEALSDAGVKVGLSRDVAQLLAAQTVLGAAKMVMETKEHPGRLKDMVTSPGGTAIAGLHTLEQGGLRTTLINAVESATHRSKKLGQQ
ncbi:MAG: pyrroline-5-carboxylate reductase [candidate division NC10 bacterium]|nr:pyrroline-5-carboxylate reductase [candidate division NC10 bacterium]